MKQVFLEDGTRHQIVWLAEEPLIKVGNFVRLKGEEIFWKILRVYEPSIDKKALRTDWRVGGL